MVRRLRVRPRSLHSIRRITPDVQARPRGSGQLETVTPASPMRWNDGELVACAVCKQRMQRRGHLSGDCEGANNAVP
jgi:hypothetical protein